MSVSSTQRVTPSAPDSLPELETRQRLQRLADGVNVAASRTVSAIIETGRRLLAAKAKAGHGGWEQLFDPGVLERPIAFSIRTARRFMAVAENAVIVKSDNLVRFPASLTVLEEVAKLPDAILTQALADGRINSEMTTPDVGALYQASGEKIPTRLVKFRGTSREQYGSGYFAPKQEAKCEECGRPTAGGIHSCQTGASRSMEISRAKLDHRNLAQADAQPFEMPEHDDPAPAWLEGSIHRLEQAADECLTPRAAKQMTPALRVRVRTVGHRILDALQNRQLPDYCPHGNPRLTCAQCCKHGLLEHVCISCRQDVVGLAK